MTELTLDGKNYVSSKRAAEITGYAKDYIGQLCREGRIEARQVGRAWYVLESALREHRFGKQEAHAKEKAGSTTETSSHEPLKKAELPVTATWEAPRYQAEQPEMMPHIERPATETPTDGLNKIQGTKSLAATAAPSAALKDLHDAWKEWFSNNPVPELEPERLLADHEEGVTRLENETPKEETGFIESEAVAVPIERIMPQQTARVRQQIRDEHVLDDREPIHEAADATPVGKSSVALRVIFAIIALVAVVVGIIGSGVADNYLKTHHYMTFFERVQGVTSVK